MKSESIGALAKALAAAQLKIRGAEKDSKNPYYKTTYADLSSVWEACHGALNAVGIAVSQTTRMYDEQLLLDTLLIHESGEYLSSEYPIIPIKKDPQGYGSALTYARRYCLAAICGVCAIEDDDGNAASNCQQQQQQRLAKPKAQITYDPTNIAHKTGMKTHLNKLIPFDDSKIDVYKKINEECKDVLLTDLHTHVAQLAAKYRGEK